MTDSFTLGHYLHNARRLRKTAADAAPVGTDDQQRRMQDNTLKTFQRNSQQFKQQTKLEDRSRQQGLPANAIPEIWKSNYNTWNIANRYTGAAKDKYLKDNLIDTKNPGSAPQFGGWNRVGASLGHVMNGVSWGTGYNVGYGNAPVDNSFLGRNHNLMNFTLDTLTAPYFNGAFYVNSQIPVFTQKLLDDSNPNKGWAVPAENGVRAIGSGVAGATANKWVPKAVAKLTPNAVKRPLAAVAATVSSRVPWLGPALKYIAPGAGLAQMIWSNVEEMQKPIEQLRAEAAEQDRGVRFSNMGNTAGAKWGRISDNAWENALPTATDAVGTTLMFASPGPMGAFRGSRSGMANAVKLGLTKGNKAMGFLSNGRAVRALRLMHDDFRDSDNPRDGLLRTILRRATPIGFVLDQGWKDYDPKNNRLLYGYRSSADRGNYSNVDHDVFWSDLADLSGWELFGGGKTAGRGPVEKQIYENALHPTNTDKMHQYKENLRRQGYTEQQVRDEMRRLLTENPYRFDYNEADLIRRSR